MFFLHLQILWLITYAGPLCSGYFTPATQVVFIYWNYRNFKRSELQLSVPFFFFFKRCLHVWTVAQGLPELTILSAHNTRNIYRIFRVFARKSILNSRCEGWSGDWDTREDEGWGLWGVFDCFPRARCHHGQWGWTDREINSRGQ